MKSAGLTLSEMARYGGSRISLTGRVAEFSAGFFFLSFTSSPVVLAVLPVFPPPLETARNEQFRERDVAKPADSDYFVRLNPAAAVSDGWREGISVQNRETAWMPVNVLRPIVHSQSTNFQRSLRLMPARTVCFGSPFLAAAVSVLLWLVAGPIAQAQNAGENTADARPSDLEKKPEDAGLQPGLIQARDALPELAIINELVTEGDETDFKRKLDKPFQDALKSPTLTDAEKKAIDAGVKHVIYRFTMKKYFEEEPAQKGDKVGALPKGAPPKERLHDLRKKLIDSIRNNPKLTAATREYLLKQITERCAELLDNNLIVRQNILLLLAQLPADNGNIAKGIEPAPYIPAYSVFLKVIKDDKQHEVLKITALVGLLRICRVGFAAADPANDKKRADIAMALVPELAKKNTHWWYQYRLAECLGTTGVTYDPANKTNPIVLQTLAEVVADKDRHWQARCEAAKAIGLLPLDNTLNMTPVLFEIVKLGYDMAQAYNANPKRDSWTNYFVLQLYMAFKAENAKVPAPGGKRKPGLLAALPASKEVKDAYEQVLQMALQFVGNPGAQFTAPQLNGFDTWLRNHTPTNRRITANSPELGTKPASAPKPMPLNGKSATQPTTPVAGP
jgi:hypothetical protein